MLKVARFLKFIPLLFVTFGTILIFGAFFIKSQDVDSQSADKNDQIQPQVAGESSKKDSEAIPSDKITSKVIRVIDGDTVELEFGQKVRYIGIDTPETVHPTKSIECFGREASNKNKELVEGKNVILEKDISETDVYGRLLRYVYIEGIFVNDYLVRQGFASSSSYPPDVKFQEQFHQAEIEARQNSQGLWTACSGGVNQQSAPSNQQASVEQDVNGCAIKGNISSTGEKIYHTPGQYYYNKTQIDKTKGEKWFCSEDDAQSAGWRKSKK